MDIYSTLIVILCIYSILFFIDRFYKTCSHYPYIQFLKGTGLDIKFLQINWNTTALNRTFLRWGSGHSSFFNFWFQYGTYATLLLLPVAILMLIATVFQNLTKKTISTNAIMEPVIPGVNLPASELGYYSLTLIISSIIHESGHALAAVREDVHLSSVGVNIYFILPVAYVCLNSDDIQKLNSKRCLKIFCAGVWHNIILSAIAYLVYLVLPFLFSSAYVLNTGIIVTNIEKNSPLRGNNGIFIDDKIVQINNCIISDYDTWLDCIQKTKLSKPGFCVTADIINKLDETIYVKHISNGEVNCCPSDKTSSACFEYIEHNDGIVEIPEHSCLAIRPVIEKSVDFCNSEMQCPINFHCVRPLLNNNTNIMKISCTNKNVIYMGHPYDLLQTLEVSQYIPKYKFINSKLPVIIERIFKYIIIFSLGFAVINVIPCFAMDGQHITNALLNVTLGKKHSQKTLTTISLSLSLIGTFLLACLAIHTIWIHLPF